MSKQSEKLLHIATLGKTVGLKGDMKLHLHTDFPEQFVRGVSFLIDSKESLTISEINREKTMIKLVGFDSPESIKKFTNKKLYTTMERTRKECHLNDGEFFWFDLEGCSIVENGLVLGIVDEVERISITNYLNIITDNKLIEKGLSKSFLLPLTKPFVLHADIEKKVITTDGALDILEAS